MVITGAGRGLGLITAREFARVGARVVLGVRDEGKARQAVAGLPGTFVIRPLDVSDLTSVRAFADFWSGDIDILINNAGVMDIPAARTADGLDLQTTTNHTGPFLLTNLLLEHITDRVVHVTSDLHKQGKIDLADLDWRTRKHNGMRAYQASKLAAVLFSLELQRRLTAAGSPVRSVLASPGIARTTLAAHSRSNVTNARCSHGRPAVGRDRRPRRVGHPMSDLSCLSYLEAVTARRSAPAYSAGPAPPLSATGES
ncbi:SDR family NAD(P)-dependent oxidoreductase [Streptomyces sp. NBS 14/10]|uniref:SDR family NAD(P)-dependent oxidoreductase n=1 Tax=Streptomyces sp. NBS 14/10 TaxID=1945643 RepID=UPI00211B495A|nr:SDR family NAD(P)-dependent oxidoreductase [Streptomyces sp. NBS 14/10]KAK1180213.1 SDR family NAD(P)-dependent oxidoreductase [Streptomyces sp. NBS 14/10]